MSIDKKTIGPMTLASDGTWEFRKNGRYVSHLCGEVLSERFNIPRTAKKLWVTLTTRRPKHGDAIRVRFSGLHEARLDDDTDADTCITDLMRNEAEDFGDDFYATIHYA